ncbi:MAG TPA: queuosine precursor transporter [Drouetiella sp.]
MLQLNETSADIQQDDKTADSEIRREVISDRFPSIEIQQKSIGDRVPSAGNSSAYTLIVGGYVAVIVISIAAASKFIALGPFYFSGATLIWPLTFVFNDIFSEVYGYERSRRIIWTGMAVQALAAFSYWLVDVIPAAPFWHQQAAYSTIMGQAPRVVASCLVCYICGEWVNSVVISKMKFAQKGRRGIHQAMRFMASTALGELVDTVIFFPLAFLGTVPTMDLLYTMLCIYIAKLVYELLSLPVSTRVANYVKRIEGLDVIDDPQTTDYKIY